MPTGGDGLTSYTITDAGRGKLLPLLEDLAWDSSSRFDKLAAAEAARRVLVNEFHVSPNAFPPSDFDPSRYQLDGVTLLPYSSTDLFLSARAALVVPDLLDTAALRDALAAWADDAAATRERTIVALAGLAGLGDDVLDRLRSYDPSAVTVRERVWLGLGFAASGDQVTALRIERDLLEAAGQRWGPWVRLSTGTTLSDTVEASGLLLLLAARLGDPIADELARYVLEVGSAGQVFPLELLGYVQGSMERLSREPARFAWTVDGKRHVVDLELGGGTSLVLTGAQRATFSLERLKGDLAVVTTWTTSDVTLPTSSAITVTRSVSPAGDAPDDRLVHVTITVHFGAQSAPGCYLLTDLTPSGLSPVAQTAGWPDEESQPYDNYPYSVSGQVVSWCASPGDRSHDYVYSARVVSPGTYRWEPALLQYQLAPGIGAATPGGTYTIR